MHLRRPRAQADASEAGLQGDRRALPDRGRFFRKIGSTFVLKNSKSSAVIALEEAGTAEGVFRATVSADDPACPCAPKSRLFTAATNNSERTPILIHGMAYESSVGSRRASIQFLAVTKQFRRDPICGATVEAPGCPLRSRVPSRARSDSRRLLHPEQER